MDIEKLRSMLSGGKEYGNVIFCDGFRFAPKGTYKSGEHTSESLKTDGFMVATFGEEGAEKLGYVSKKFTFNPYLWLANSGQTVSALDEGYLGYGLSVDGDYHDDDRYGRALGGRDGPAHSN